MECHVQLFNAQWRDAAVVAAPNPEQGGVRARAMFEYDLQYVFNDSTKPVSLAYPVDAQNHVLNHWPAFLFDLIPQGNGRKFLLGHLGLPDDKSADFALLCAGAFNPIGNLRITEAVAYFRTHVERHPGEQFADGMSLDDVLQRGAEFTERMMIHSMLAAGTTGVQGAAPKFLLTRDHNGLWHADGALADAHAADHYIVKLPRGKTEEDRVVLRNERAYMDTAAAVGIRVHGQPLFYQNNMLFIPRFDRRVSAGRVERLHQESIASVAGIVGFDARPSQYDLVRAIRNVVTDKETETIEFLKRDVLNLAMRNTDNHARNTAIQIVGNEIRLTPLFDFAPMYMDPEGIARAARWYHPETLGELAVWGDVIDAIEMGEQERARIRAAMARFGRQIERLSETMRECGVDDEIVSYLQPSIDTQIRQLLDLAPPGGREGPPVRRRRP